MNRLPLAVSSNKDELVTSWLSRNAALYDATSRELCELIGSTPYKINRTVTPTQRETIGRLFGTRETALCNQLEERTTGWPGQIWVGSGLASATMGAGVEFCTKCFEEDRRTKTTPYLRWQWSSAWSCRCHIHKILLTTSCDNNACYFKHQEHACRDIRPTCSHCPEGSSHFSTFFKDPRLDLDVGQRVWGLPDQRLFEESIHAAMEGKAPGDAWIAGKSASGFVEVSTRLVSYLCLRVKHIGMSGGHPLYHSLTFPIAPRLGKQFPGSVELQLGPELLSKIPFHARLLVLQTLGIILQKKHHVEWGYWTLVYKYYPIIWFFSGLPKSLQNEFIELFQPYDESIARLLKLAIDHQSLMVHYQQLSTSLYRREM